MERLVRLYRGGSSAAAVILLLGFNLLPLAGVLLWGWNAQSLLVLYWLENGIVGLLAIARIVGAAGSVASNGPTPTGSWTSSASKVFLVPFFLFHYGIFWLVHGVFVFALPLFLGLPGLTDTGAPIGPTTERSPTDLRWDAIALGGIGLAISHAASFVLNYVGRGEYRTTSPVAEMMAPYGRVVILHVAIILGVFVSLRLGTSIGSLVVLVVLKTLLDLALHLREHRVQRQATPQPGHRVDAAAR